MKTIYNFSDFRLDAKRIAKFWATVDKTGKDGCWIMTTAPTAPGYSIASLFRLSDRRWCSVRAHRLAYFLVKGPIPDGLQIDHLCRNKRCVNPDHLEAVTGRENILRGISPTAINARRTSCVRGHVLTGANVATKGRGNRECMACRELFSRRRERETTACAICNAHVHAKWHDYCQIALNPVALVGAIESGHYGGAGLQIVKLVCAWTGMDIEKVREELQRKAGEA